MMKRNWKFVEGPQAAASWGRMGGSEVEKLPAILEALGKIKQGVSLKGNLFKPVITAGYEGYPLWGPINYLAYPERRLESGMHVFKPGYGLPVHVHDYADETFLVVKGNGKFMIDEQEFDAGPFDVFYAPCGSWHTAYNPAENEEDFYLYIVGAPALSFKMREEGWELTENLWAKLGYRK